MYLPDSIKDGNANVALLHSEVAQPAQAECPVVYAQPVAYDPPSGEDPHGACAWQHVHPTAPQAMVMQQVKHVAQPAVQVAQQPVVQPAQAMQQHVQVPVVLAQSTPQYVTNAAGPLIQPTYPPTVSFALLGCLIIFCFGLVPCIPLCVALCYALQSRKLLALNQISLGSLYAQRARTWLKVTYVTMVFCILSICLAIIFARPLHHHD